MALLPRTINALLSRRYRQGFTLVELLVVMSIMVLLSVIVLFGIQNVAGLPFDRAISDLQASLIRARAYAMANNTYVYVGIEEVDSTVDVATIPQVQNDNGGRIALAAVATNDGLNDLTTNAGNTAFIPATAPNTTILPALNPNNTALPNVTIVQPLQVFENLHMKNITFSGNPLFSTQMPAITDGTNGYVVGGAKGVAPSGVFTWPLTGAARYTFLKVIQFSPQGEAQMMIDPTKIGTLQWIELGILPNSQNNAANKNNAVLLIDGVSGNVKVYRPQ